LGGVGGWGEVVGGGGFGRGGGGARSRNKRCPRVGHFSLHVGHESCGGGSNGSGRRTVSPKSDIAEQRREGRSAASTTVSGRFLLAEQQLHIRSAIPGVLRVMNRDGELA